MTSFKPNEIHQTFLKFLLFFLLDFNSLDGPNWCGDKVFEGRNKSLKERIFLNSCMFKLLAIM